MHTSDLNKEGTKILSWNINGIRTFENIEKTLSELDSDIVCFQETKVSRDMLLERVACVPGYSSYFSFSRRRVGYSGVATYCKATATPVWTQDGLTSGPGSRELAMEFNREELRALDSEGRCVITSHNIQGGCNLSILNLYCPRADPEREDRARFKLHFYKAVDIVCHSLLARGDHVVVLGDINCSHRQIDHCDPYEEFGERPDRRFLDHFLEELKAEKAEPKGKHVKDGEELDGWECSTVELAEKQFNDSFRIFNPERSSAFTCWNTEKNCRSTNYGTRIDYVFTSLGLRPLLTHSDILPDVHGSDHCPVYATFSLTFTPCSRPPEGCSKYFKEFQGKQVKVSNFFTALEKKAVEEDLCKKRKVGGPITDLDKAKKQKFESKSKITSFFATKTPNDVEKKAAVCTVGNDKDSIVNEESFLNINNGQATRTTSAVVAKDKNGEAKNVWGALFKPPAPAPLCPGHGESCVKRKVNKKGPNIGREFWCCARGEGKEGDPEARCNFFKWTKEIVKKR